jgi:hypothetical protein
LSDIGQTILWQYINGDGAVFSLFPQDVSRSLCRGAGFRQAMDQEGVARSQCGRLASVLAADVNNEPTLYLAEFKQRCRELLSRLRTEACRIIDCGGQHSDDRRGRQKPSSHRFLLKMLSHGCCNKHEFRKIRCPNQHRGDVLIHFSHVNAQRLSMTGTFPDQLTDVYDAMIDWSKRLDHEGPFYRTLFERLSAKSVVDVACGTGHHAAMFHDWGLEVEASD